MRRETSRAYENRPRPGWSRPLFHSLPKARCQSSQHAPKVLPEDASQLGLAKHATPFSTYQMLVSRLPPPSQRLASSAKSNLRPTFWLLTASPPSFFNILQFSPASSLPLSFHNWSDKKVVLANCILQLNPFSLAPSSPAAPLLSPPLLGTQN